MKIICLQENLKRSIAVVSHINNKNINLPILNNILLKASDSGIDLISTNLEIGITHQLRGKVEEVGEITVDSKILSDYINLLPGSKVEIVELEEDVSIKCDSYKTKIKGESSKDFPLIPSVDKNLFCEINLFDFKKAISSVSFAAASSDNRLELSGILFSFDEKKLTLASTDSYRLAEKKINFKNGNIDNLNVIVPSKTINEVSRIITTVTGNPNDVDSDLIKIYISDNQILFSFSSIEIVSRLINGQYPDYRQIIPDKYKTEVELDRDDLIRAVKASAVFSKNGVYDISLVFRKDILNVYSSSGQSGESSVDLKCDLRGDNNDISVNYRYLIDGLNVLDSEKVVLKVINNNTPCQITSPEDNTYVYIIMPIRS